jgi:hypothetical protein
MKTLERKNTEQPKKQMGQFATIEDMLNYSTARAEKVLAKAKGLELK